MSNIEVIDGQLEAYNARDIERFLSYYEPNCKLEDAEGNILQQGPEEIRARYTSLFETSPDLKATIANRIVIGSYLIDEETIQGHRGKKEMHHAVVVYRVENSRIVHVRFIS